MSMCFDVVALSSHPTREPYELCFGKIVIRDSFFLLNVTRSGSKGPAMVLTTFTANSRPDKSEKPEKNENKADGSVKHTFGSSKNEFCQNSNNSEQQDEQLELPAIDWFPARFAPLPPD